MTRNVLYVSSFATANLVIFAALRIIPLSFQGLNLPPGPPTPIDPSSYDGAPDGGNKGPDLGKGIGIAAASVGVGAACEGYRVIRLGEKIGEDAPAIARMASSEARIGIAAGEEIGDASRLGYTQVSKNAYLDKELSGARSLNAATSNKSAAELSTEEYVGIERDVSEARDIANWSNKAATVGTAESSEVVLNIVAKEHDLDLLGDAVLDLPTSKADGVWETRLKWGTDPAYRATVVRELAEANPSSLAELARRSATVRAFDEIDPIVRSQDAIDQLVKEEFVYTTHSTVHVPDVPVSMIEDAQTELQNRIERIVGDVLKDLPDGVISPTDAQLRKAVAKALKPDPRFSYGMNVETGKLTLKMHLGNGEISGEPNIYALGKKALYLMFVGTGITNKGDIVRLAKKYFGTQASQNYGHMDTITVVQK